MDGKDEEEGNLESFLKVFFKTENTPPTQKSLQFGTLPGTLPGT